MSWLLTVGALVMGIVQADAPQSHDRLTYEMGGLMSTPTKVGLDLTTGDFDLREGGQHINVEVRRTHGRLTTSTLANVKRYVALAMTKGLKTASCRREERKGRFFMPIMDAIPRVRTH